MRVIQITDLHVGQEGEDTYFVDVRENFRQIIAAVQERRPDYLVLSGDLCYDQGDEEIYAWIKAWVDQLGIPYEVIPGNHDDAQLMIKAFAKEADAKPDGLYFSRNWDGHAFLFMDTSTSKVQADQLNWLKNQLQQVDGDVVLFIHHPPLLAGTPFMDNNHPLEDRDPLLEILFDHPGNISVYCGHYHVDRTVRKKNLVVHLTPSCFFQIDSNAEDFKVDHYRIAFREISLQTGLTTSSVHYL